MLKLVASLVIVSSCLALEAEPAQTESGFTAPVVSLPQLVAQEQYFRRVADISLGLHISQSFSQFAQAEYQMGQQLLSEATRLGFGPASADSRSVVDPVFPVHHAAVHAPVLVHSVVADADSSDDEEDEVASEREDDEEDLEEYESAAEDLEQSDDDDVALLELKEETVSLSDLQNLGSFHKISALKAMQIQFYLAAGDVQKTYWVNRIVALILPPQLSIFKLYKSYINTMSLSIAFQFHDSFTQEAYLDDFNDRWGRHTGISSQYAEALSEQNTFHHWTMLAQFKYQLILINMYEKMFFAQIAAQQQGSSAAAVSLLEVDAEAQFFSPLAGAGMYPYLQWYQLMLRWMAITTEMQLAQTGLYVAQTKVAVGSGKANLDGATVKAALQVETTTLPSLYMQWASLNQQKYYLDMYSMMIEMYAPQLAAATANERAENVFQNLVQTDAKADKDPVA